DGIDLHLEVAFGNVEELDEDIRIRGVGRAARGDVQVAIAQGIDRGRSWRNGRAAKRGRDHCMFFIRVVAGLARISLAVNGELLEARGIESVFGRQIDDVGNGAVLIVLGKNGPLTLSRSCRMAL